tara:strand:+ start:1652 stop:2719 length:1068 start_codon:yes stop_codon:yes gene_type:complete
MHAIKKLLIALAILAVAAGLYYYWVDLDDEGFGEGFASGNGRLEAVEIDIATKLAGRIHNVLVDEGDMVIAGQTLALMDTKALEAQRGEAIAQHQQATHLVLSAEAQVVMRESDQAAAEATVVQRESELDSAQRHLARTEALARDGAASTQELDDDRARVNGSQAAVSAARAQVAAARAAVEAARAQLIGTRSSVTAALATIARIDADINDSQLVSPRDGRVQFRVAQPGEVLAAGGRVLNLVDLNDVHMAFFLPTEIVGRVALGSEARIVLDTMPNFPIPARISFVSSTAQFTPRTVETASERQKLMFRVKAQIDPELLREHQDQVKTGLPGVAWVKLDADAEWPAALAGQALP